MAQNEQEASRQSLADRISRAQLGERGSQIQGRLARMLAQSQASLFGQSEIDRSSGLPFLTRLKVDAADTEQEKREAFLSDYPNGQFARVPVSGEYVFRFDTNDETEFVKSIERESFPEGPAGNFARALEFSKDVTELVTSNIGTIASEALIAIATSGRSLIFRLMGQTAGGVVGEVLQEGAENIALPSQGEGLSSLGMRAGTSGAAAPIGYMGGVALSRLLSGATGRGFISARPEARDAMLAIEELNLILERSGSDIRIPQLSVGQAAEMPIFKRIEEQSAAATAPVRRQREAQVNAVQRVLDSATDPASLDRARTVLDDALVQREQQIRSIFRDPGVVMSSGGRALERGIQEYDEQAQVAIQGLYNIAERIESPIFDLGSVMEVGTLQHSAMTMLEGLQRQARTGAAGRVSFRGRRMTRLKDDFTPRNLIERGPEGQVLQLRPLDKDVAEIAKEILAIRPGQVDTEVLRAWQQRLWDLKQVPTGWLKTDAQTQAANLYREVTQVLWDAKNSSPAFRRAWQTANQRAAARFDNLENATVVRILRSGDGSSAETIEQLANSLQSPYQASNIRFLKSIVPQEQFELFRDSFKTRLIRRGNITETLDSFRGDEETLGLLLSPSERSALRRLGEEQAKLDSTGVRQALANQSQPRATVMDIINYTDTAQAAQLERLARESGGMRAPFARSIRVGIIDAAFETFISQGDTRQISEVAVNEFIKKIDRSGLRGFLEDRDKAIIRNLSKLAPFFRFSRGGAGASIQAAEAAEGIISARRGAIVDLIQKAGAGRVLINPVARRFLLGSPSSDPIDSESIRVLAAITATISAQAVEEQSQ